MSSKKAPRDLCDDATRLDENGLNRISFHENGGRELTTKSWVPKPIDAAKEYNITAERKYLRKEIESVSFAQAFLTTLNTAFEIQKTVGQYRVDLYLAFEIDEHGRARGVAGCLRCKRPRLPELRCC